MASKALVFLVLALAVAVTVVDCNSESDALYEWRTNVVDPNNVLQSWDWTLVNPCSWLHITCNNQNSVTSVQLGVAGLSGPLLPVLGQLSNLQYLELYGNQFSGPIPSAIGNLTSLISLDLYNNQLSGVIPSTLGNLKSLKFMRLNSNNLSGHIPDEVIHLIQWRNLEILNVSDNSLAGSAQRHPNTKNLFSVTTIVQDAKA